MGGGGKGKGRRGHHQRAAERVATNERISLLMQWAVEQWAFGLLWASDVQRICHYAQIDHQDSDARSTSPEGLDLLAAIGSSGAHCGNCHRDLERILLRKWSDAPKPMRFPLTMLSLKVRDGERQEVEANQALLLPCEIISFLYAKKQQKFADRFLGGG